MKHFKYILIITFIALIGKSINATEVCEIHRGSDALLCALKKHPSIVLAQTQVPIASINRELSSRWLNPELEAGVGYTSTAADGTGITVDIAVMQTIETSSKRGARRAQANAEYAYAFATLEEQKEEAMMQMLSTLNRLRQIDKEKHLLDETINTFVRLIRRYNARPALSPEDRISADLFRFVLNNYRIEKNQLEAEEKELIGTLEPILCCDTSITQKLFLYSPKIWPKIDDNNIENSTILAKEQANIDQAKANYLDAKSSSFGEFRVGPYIQTKPGDISTIDAYGAKFEIPIPISSNKKSTEAGRLALSSAEFTFEAKKRELETGINNLKTKYTLGISTLASYDIKEIERHHIRAKNLFDSGRVSGGLLIEVHRQMVDSIRTYHQYEMETLQALWQIYALQKKLLTNLNEVYDENI